jgi:succinate-semialdehyde dehydrogenase / glutarate-semialdehyde dehydrogenase
MPLNSIQSINPATGKAISSYKLLNKKSLSTKIEMANEAQVGWSSNNLGFRQNLMMAAAQGLRDSQDKYAMLMVEEMGKPIKDARAEVQKCAWVCEYYAKNAAQFLADEVVLTEAKNSIVAFQPIGLVLAVMPWNFPFWQVFRFAAPALMAGNGGLLKHASNVPGCATAIEELFESVGFPKGLFSNLNIQSKDVESVIRHPLVKAITLTGSEPAGRSVAKLAGECLKKTVLELGGSDPYIVLADADLELAADTCCKSRLLNAGQSCISAKRFVVVKDVYDDFLKLFLEKMAAVNFGDPSKEATVMGPMARIDLRDELHEQVVKSVEAGAKCLLGGNIPKLKGAFYPPTILVDVKPGMPAHDEELFGPVAAVIKAEDEADAIRIANDSQFGLGGAIFTKNEDKGLWIAKEKLHVGSCFVNSMVKSDPRLPFGGIKNSGYGRELSHFGIREFVNIKTIWVQ